MSAPLLGMGIGLLVFAAWSDAIGRCRILIGGLAVGVVISLLLPLVTNYPLFLAMRFAQGAFFSVCPAIAVPLLGDELRKSWLPSAVGFYVASNTIGGISSRLVGGIVTDIFNSWQAAGITVAVVTALFFAIVVYIIPKQRHFAPHKFHLSDSLRAYKTHLSNPQLLTIYIIIGLGFGCFVNLMNYLMIVLKSEPYALPSSVRSVLFLTLLGGTTSSTLAGKFSKHFNLISGIVTGVIIMLLANFMMNIPHILFIIAAMTLLSVGFFFCHAQASALIGKKVKKDKGSAQALYSLFYYSGASFGVFLLEPFYQAWGWQGVIGSTGIALSICVLLAVIYQSFSTQNSAHVHSRA